MRPVKRRGRQARSPIEALRLRAHRLWVMRDGRLIARSPVVSTQLKLPGGTRQVDTSA